MASFNVEFKVVNQTPEGTEATQTKRTITDVREFLNIFLQRFVDEPIGAGVPDVQYLTIRRVPDRVVRGPKGPEVKKS